MNPLTYLKNMTFEDVQRITRTAMTLIAGSLVTHGVISPTATWISPTIGALVFAVSFAWQLYGNRLNAKLGEIAKMNHTPEMAKVADAAVVAIAANNAVAATTVEPVAKVAALVTILILGTLMVPTLGYAQTPKPRDAFGVPGGIINSPRTVINAIETKQSEDITKFLTDLADISGAITLSQQIPALQDPVGNACWLQFNGIGELLKIHPSPLNLKLASDWEALRLLAIGLNQVCANPNCGQMFLDATNAVGALAPIQNGLSLASICAKIPVIGTSAVPTAAAPISTVGTVVAPAPAVPAKP